MQSQTHHTLADYTQARQVRQQQITAQLHTFVQQLQQDTAEFMALTTANREVMAQELAAKLQRDVTDLRLAVAALRADLQGQIQGLQAVTQLYLEQCAADRTAMSAAQRQELTEYMAQVRSQVETYLAELDILRQSRAYELQTMLEASREQRLTDVAELFDDIAILRGDLRQYRQQLSQQVWGNLRPTPRSPQPAPRRPVTTKPAATRVPTRTTAAKPSATPAAKRPASSKPAAPKPGLAAIARPARTAAPAPKVSLASPPPVNTLAKSAAVSTVPTVPATPTSTATLERPSVAAPTAAPADELLAIEQMVYQCIQDQGGLRLGELEAQLGLNRFQTVDALRSLIRQEKITQRDRVYVVN